MKFKKDLMIKRLTNEGRHDMIDVHILNIMTNLDGQEATENCWNRKVKNEPVLYVIGKDGEGFYVNENDCE